MGNIFDCGNTGFKRCAIHIERAANTVDRIANRGRRIHPAQTQISEPKNLRECARHDHILIGSNKLYALRIIIAADIFRIGAIQHENSLLG